MCTKAPGTAVFKVSHGAVDTRRVYRKRAGLSLFGFYAIVTLIPIVILGTLLARSYREDLDRRGLEDAGEIAAAVAEAAVYPNLSGDSLRDGPTPEERTKLTASMQPILREHTALRLRLRDRAGRIVFDPSRPSDKLSGSPDHKVVEALNGKDISFLTRVRRDDIRILTRINGDPVDRESTLGAQAINVYEPVFSTSGPDTALGALDISVPYKAIAESIETSYRHMTMLMGGGLFAVWFVLATISWSVTRRLRRSAAVNQHLARHDSLTGLANRMAAAEYLDHVLESTGDRSVAVVRLDIDGFNQINEVLGYENGDQFLVHVADQLRAVATPTDLVARIGGDEFGIVMPDTDGRGATDLINRLRRALLTGVELGGIGLAVEITAGWVQGHADHRAAEILRRAGVAVRAAKAARIPTLGYNSTLEGFDADRLALVSEFRHAIGSEQLVLHYQPKISTDAHKVVGVEALLRWQHPTRGLLHPGAFLPGVESTESIIPLTDWVMDTACRQAAVWQRIGRRLPIAVNVSARCLRDPTFADRMLATLVRHQVDVRLVTLEITETAVISDPARAAATLRRLADRGVHISIDDFGVGYTSLSQLQQLPIHELKIDRQFVAPLLQGPDGAAVARAVISLGHELGMTVVAEGVEDDATLCALADLGCDFAQGYRIGYPLPAPELEHWLENRETDCEREHEPAARGLRDRG